MIDVEGVCGSFAAHFVESSPVGIQGGKNGLLFRWMIPKGFRHYKNIGTKEMNIANLDVSQLNAQHWMAKLHWNSVYEKKDGAAEQINFDVIYYLTTQSGAPKIFAYITGDEQKVLKDRGII